MKGALLFGACCALVSVAQANVLYDLGPFDPELAFASDAVAGQFNNQRLSEAFVLGQSSQVESVVWWGRSEGSFFPDLTNMSSFTVSLYVDAGATPGAQVFTSTVPISSVTPTVVGQDSSGNNLYSFNFQFGQTVALQSGTYWLSVGTTNVDPDGDGFYWQASQLSVSRNFNAQTPGDATWNTSGFADLALQVNGTAAVPEPASVLVLGIPALLALRRRRKG